MIADPPRCLCGHSPAEHTATPHKWCDVDGCRCVDYWPYHDSPCERFRTECDGGHPWDYCDECGFLARDHVGWVEEA